jgi:4-amino-4-deoxy-L-arabinose transferase-like glycosyltransferase
LRPTFAPIFDETTPLMLKQFALHKPENWFLLATLALTLFVRLRHIDIPLERDEGEYAYAAQAILRGELPYRDFYNMKLPAVYYSYAALFWLAGDTLRTIKISLIFLNLINAFLTFLIAKRLVGQAAAQFSAGIYLLYSLSWSAQGWTANAEHFVLLPALLGVYCSIRAYQNEGRSGIAWAWLVAAGVSMASAFLCKQHALAYIGFVPILLIVNFLEKIYYGKMTLSAVFALPLHKSLFGQYFFMGLAYGVGVMVVAGSFWVWILANNLTEQFWFLTYDYAQAYVSAEAHPFKNIGNFSPIFGDAFVFWILTFAGIIFLYRHAGLSRARWVLLTLFACSFLCVLPGGYFRPHYFQLLFPAAAIFAGFGVAKLDYFLDNAFYKKILNTQNTVENPEKKPRKRLLTTPSVCALGLVAFMAMSPRYVFTQTSQEVVERHYIGAFFPESLTIGQFLRENTPPNAVIGMIGDEPEIAFYARRRLASGYLYSYPFFENQKFAEQMQNQFLQEMETARPDILLYFCTTELDENWLPRHSRIEDWYMAFGQHYDIIGKVHRTDKYTGAVRWRSTSDDLTQDKEVFCYILRRKAPPQYFFQ